MKHAAAIVIVPRTNRFLESETIRDIARRMGEEGHDVYWYESPRVAASGQINRVIARRWPALALTGDVPLPPLRNLARVIVKTAFALAGKHRANFLLGGLMGYPALDVRELDRFTRDLPHETVHFIGHSAGAIFATRMAAGPAPDPRIGRILCFGYPLRALDQTPQAYRSDHLPRVRVPLLMIQGTQDPYVSDVTLLRAALPDHADILTTPCDHDYNGLTPPQFTVLWEAARTFLTGQPTPPGEHVA